MFGTLDRKAPNATFQYLKITLAALLKISYIDNLMCHIYTNIQLHFMEVVEATISFVL